MDPLARALASTTGTDAESIALRTLTLHMLQHVAPTLFATHQLDAQLKASLEACAGVDYAFGTFSSLDPDRFQAGIDAWLCRRLHGLPHPAPERGALRVVLEFLAHEAPIYAWLLGELAARLGVDARITFEGERPFAHTRLEDAYFLTHLVMLDTDYFAKPASHEDVDEWAEELTQLIPWLKAQHLVDLAGEVALCLRFLGHDAHELDALLAHAHPHEPHTQCAVLLGLAATEVWQKTRKDQPHR